MESVAAVSGHFSSISFDLFSILQLLLLMNNKKMWVYRIKHPKMTCRGGHFSINVLCPKCVPQSVAVVSVESAHYEYAFLLLSQR